MAASVHLRMADWYVPQPGPQYEFHSSPAKYPLLHGTRGGGKSLALLAEAVRECITVPGSNSLLLRRTLTASEKGGIEDHFEKYVPREFYNRFDRQMHIVTFDNKSRLFFGHIKADRDLGQYQGGEFLFVGWDELTQFNYKMWDFLKGSNRCPIERDVYGARPRARMAGGTNPNGIGSGWVKALWITKKPPAGETVTDYDPADYHDIFSSYAHNRVYANDAEYIGFLASISDPVLRAAWVKGSWDILAGQYYQNWDEERERNLTRPLEEIIFEDWQPRWISIDWGYEHACVVLWFTRAKVKFWWNEIPQDVIVCYRERVVRKLNETALAQKIAVDTGVEQITNVYLSPERFAKINSEHSIADVMGDTLREFGLPRPERADNERVSGWRLIGDLFETDGIVIAKQCKDLIGSIPKLMRDEKDLEDAYKEGNDLHLDVMESFRYGLKSYLRNAPIPREVQEDRRIKAITDNTQKYLEWLRQRSRPQGSDMQLDIPQPRRPWEQ